MRIGRCADDHGVGPRLRDQFLDGLEGRRTGASSPLGALLLGAVGTPDDLGTRHRLEAGNVEAAGRPPESYEPEPHPDEPSELRLPRRARAARALPHQRTR